MTLRKRAAALLAAVIGGGSLTIMLPPPPPAAALAPAPVILNNGAFGTGNAQWMETQSQPDDGGASVKQFVATFLVQHAVGRVIDAVKIDANFDGTDNAPGNAEIPVSSQTFVAAAGGIETSRVTVGIGIGKPGGFSCPTFGSATRRVDAPVRMRVVDSTNEQSATVSTTVHFVEDGQCGGRADFPRMTSVSQNTTEVGPGQDITYTFSCDDVDTDFFSSDDDCDRANIRWRRLDNGDTSASTLKAGINDNTNTTHTMSFPSQGFYVVEAQLGNEDGNFPDSGGWWRLGNAVVNDPASSLSGSLAFSGVQPSSPPSVNPGTAVNAVASAADSGGAVQVIEWDADNNGSFERREYTVPANSSGNIVHPALTSTELEQSVNTSTTGLKTVQARITDNGALDAADDIRRQRTFSGQLRVNAVPTASNVNASTNEDTATTITMVGNDPDNQPLGSLVYSIVSGPPATAGTLSAVSGDKVTFTPALNFNGSTSFTYRVADGPAPNNGAFTTSNTATVSVTVNAVNDPPSVDPKSATTNEDTAVNIQATGADVEGPLTWSVASQPAHGTATCNPTTGLCTYTPATNFFGSDSFVVRGTDSGGLAATATFSVTVNPVNDAPIADSQSVTVAEDAVNFPISLTASDVDNATLTFTAPVDDVDHGTLNCLGQSCTYTPAPDYNGPDSFTFTASDGALSSTGTVSITVTPVNDAPVAVDVLDAETDEDVTLPLTLGGSDVDGDAVTVSSVTDPAQGTATVQGPNAVDYLGDAHFFGIDTFDFDVTDGNGAFDTGTVMVTVRPVNDAPVIADQSFNTLEDTPALLSIVAADVDGDALSWSVVSHPSSGQLTGEGPDVGYAPNPNFFGTDTFVVQVDDGHGGVDTATITVNIAPVNDAPVANAGSVTVDEDGSATFTLDASDVDGDALTYTAPVDGPSNGAVVCTGAACSYTPNPNFHGNDLFTFLVDDGNDATDTASVSIIVTSVNDIPVVVPASATTAEDTAVAITLMASDADGDDLAYTLSSPSHGTLQGVAPDVVYQPNLNYHGADGFDFTVTDGNGGTATAAVTIAVASVNDAPLATGGTAVTPEDTPVSFQLGGADVDGDGLTFAVTTPPAVGTLTCDAAGACSYAPPADFSGSAIVRYSVTDGALTDNGVFTVSVDPVNDPPVADDSSVTTAEDTAVDITLAAADTEGDDLIYTIEAGPTSGTLTCGDDNTDCVYTPEPNFNGADSFTWAADDGHAGHDSATVTITVTPVNDAPVAVDTSATTDEEVPVQIPLPASDVEDDPITFAIVSGPANGTIAVAGDVATYTPAVDFEGVDTFVYRATDPSGAFTEAKGTVIVTGAPLTATTMKAQAATMYIELKVGVPLSARMAFLQVAGTLKTASGAPLAGRRIDFFAGTTFLCFGITDAKGFGTCGTHQQGLAASLNLGYRAVFAGDADHAASADTGGLVGLFVTRLP